MPRSRGHVRHLGLRRPQQPNGGCWPGALLGHGNQLHDTAMLSHNLTIQLFHLATNYSINSQRDNSTTPASPPLVPSITTSNSCNITTNSSTNRSTQQQRHPQPQPSTSISHPRPQHRGVRDLPSAVRRGESKEPARFQSHHATC